MQNGAAHAAPDDEASRDDSGIRPLLLLADSQLLFRREGDRPLLAGVLSALGDGPLKAAYLGASNGDVRDFYDIFVAAMEGVGVGDTKMIMTVPSDEERAYLEEASIVLLAGGDAARGYRAFEASGLKDRILARYAAGAVLIGISAGAMLLGMLGWSGQEAPFDAFGLAPFVVGAHGEPDWAELTRVVESREGKVRGIGIPLGGGAIVHPDLSVSPVQKGLVEIRLEEGAIRRALLLPEGRGSSAG
jgi:peptidase E